MTTKHRADEIAGVLREAGLIVERKDYAMLPGEEDLGERHYVIVRYRETSTCEVQTNGLIPAGRAGSYSGPHGEALSRRVGDLLEPYGVSR